MGRCNSIGLITLGGFYCYYSCQCCCHVVIWTVCSTWMNERSGVKHPCLPCWSRRFQRKARKRRFLKSCLKWEVSTKLCFGMRSHVFVYFIHGTITSLQTKITEHFGAQPFCHFTRVSLLAISAPWDLESNTVESFSGIHSVYK